MSKINKQLLRDTCPLEANVTLEYYTYTQGAAIQKALRNAIATFFVSQSFASMMSISLMIGAAMTYAYFVATRNPKHIYIWAIVFALVPSMLIKQTVTMQVIDKTEPTAGYSVANVPYLIALPTWFFSTMMVWHGRRHRVHLYHHRR
ncbi:conjugal transfer protein TraG N-terminal domain-containing protein [Vibrio lentus]|uniref:conjugal transfer protein TraG N-terminal domain-containing protein n=1 Tax=Vibrio lentus TaxID=136468 RepID=UPI0039A44B7F